MPEPKDYSQFVFAAYLFAGIILCGFALLSIYKLKKNHTKLSELEKISKNENK